MIEKWFVKTWNIQIHYARNINVHPCQWEKQSNRFPEILEEIANSFEGFPKTAC